MADVYNDFQQPNNQKSRQETLISGRKKQQVNGQIYWWIIQKFQEMIHFH